MKHTIKILAISALLAFTFSANATVFMKIKPENFKGPRINWKVRYDTSPIDDSRSVFIWTDAVEPVHLKYESHQPRLFVRCKESKLDVFIDWGFFIGVDSANITTRFDTDTAANSKVSISTDYEATFLSNAAYRLKQLEQAETLVARITPHGESTVTTRFNVGGLSAVTKRLKESCSIE